MTPDEPETEAVPGPAVPKICAKCQENPAGPGGILCPSCKTALESRTAEDWYPSEVAP